MFKSALFSSVGLVVASMLGTSTLLAQNCNCSAYYENGSFEQPVITSGYRIMPEADVPGWSTTATDHKIEIWKTGFNGVPAAVGQQFVELNANRVGNLYQELCLEPGAQISWSVYHRGRSGVDVASIGLGNNFNSVTVLETMSDGNTSWGYYSGTYTVPPGQTVTYVVISSISSVGGNSYGNFIDGFQLTVNYDPCDDTDGDGVPDADDDYPNDAGRAFNNYFPSNGPGTLMFEDLWPYRGDYDFNDVVVDYRFTTVTNAQNYVVETMADFTLRASGAGYENGFGFQLSNNATLDASDITVSGMQINGGAIQVDANGLEMGQSIPTVIVFDNFFDLMTRPGGIGVNTQPGRPFVPHAQVSILMSYTPSTFSLLDLKIEDFNPFIYINQDRSKEVHLPNHPPTDLANSLLLGSGEDDSQVGSQRYYQTEDNLPWALNILESIPYPVEKTDIILAYPQFDNWAQSGGQQFRDWFVDQANNRVEQHLY